MTQVIDKSLKIIIFEAILNQAKSGMVLEIAVKFVIITWMEIKDKNHALTLLSQELPHTLGLLEEARKVREKHFGKKVLVHVLANAKSGQCSEDCGFCSQSVRFKTDIEEYPLIDSDDLYARAQKADEAGAEKFCIVTATRGPTTALLDQLCPSIERIKADFPDLKICTSLGLLEKDAAERLKSSGVTRYNHNLESSERHFPKLVTTHTYDDRISTVQTAKDAGLESCCGGIIGTGEDDEDIIDLFYKLKELDVESIPINFFNPRPGTPYGDLKPIEGMKALRILAIARLIHPDKDIRCAGGREVVLGTLQPFCLYAVNSIFTNGYLTTPGQGRSDDEKMISEIGYEICRET